MNEINRSKSNAPKKMSEPALIPDINFEKIISLPQETRFDLKNVSRRTVFKTPGSKALLFAFEPGQEIPEHASPHTAVVQILSGKCDFSINGKEQRLETGDVVFMPPNLRHALRAPERFSMLLTLIIKAES